jgi:hypothetical protein
VWPLAEGKREKNYPKNILNNNSLVTLGKPRG